MNTDYASNLSQSERLALAGSPCFIPTESIGADEREAVTLSRPRFPVPSIASVREHDARLTMRGLPRDKSADYEQGEECNEKDAYGSFVEREKHATACALPSTRSRADIASTLREMGMPWND